MAIGARLTGDVDKDICSGEDYSPDNRGYDAAVQCQYCGDVIDCVSYTLPVKKMSIKPSFLMVDTLRSRTVRIGRKITTTSVAMLGALLL